MTIKIGLVICTRNRSGYLLGLLSNLENKACIETILIVDSSDNNDSKKIVDNFNQTRSNVIEYIKSKPGLPRQRNIGIAWIINNKKSVNVIAFLDDDARIESEYFTIAANHVRMYKKWVAFTGNPVGILRSKPNFLRRIFMLDSKKSGRLLKSGHSTLPNPVKEIESVDWLPGISMFINPKILELEKFNSKLRMYYEDVEMSLRLRNHGAIHVIKKMKYTHLYASEGRESIGSQTFYTLGIKWEIAREFPFYLNRLAIIWSVFGSLILGFISLPISQNKRMQIGIIVGNLKFIIFTLFGKDSTQKVDQE
jgi:GT2 family glycosyltransferase